jgi:NAD(P)-dependent dehydrogenase (short-subunit alcohol dehydrogenase family)
MAYWQVPPAVRIIGNFRGLCENLHMEPKTVLITGASRGIGLALAKEMAARGWRVLAGARHPAGAHALQTAAREATGGSIDILTLDVRSDESVRGAAEEAVAKVRSLDALVNNAGVFPEEGSEPLEKLPLDCFEEAFSVNVVGVARVTRTFLPLLTRAAHSRVINISSLAGSVSQKKDARHYCYSASKAALNMLTRAMAAELRPRGITVVAVTPGWVQTEIGGPQAPLSVEESVRSLAGTIERVSPRDAGHFLDRHGAKGAAAW